MMPSPLSLFAASSLLILGLTGCAGSPGDTDHQTVGGDNPLLAEWTGPYGGVPAFDRMDLGAVRDALEAGMAASLAETDTIAADPAPPTFENTILATERSGDLLKRVMPFWGIWSANLSTPEFREIQQEMAPRLADFQSKITQNEKLFERVRAVYESDEKESLRPDQQRLVWLVYNDFAHNGATLEGAAKDRYAEINQRSGRLGDGQ